MNNSNHEYAQNKARGVFAELLSGRWAPSDILQKPTYLMGIFFMVALLLVGIGEARARPLVATAPGLGAAASFAVLGGSNVTNTGPTIVTGNLGVSPGSAVTGFPPGIVSPPSTIHAADAVALQAQSDVTTAYNDLAGQACDTDKTGQDLGGQTLTAGVYCFSSSAFLTGILTLDAQGDPSAVFIFQIGSTLITAPNSSVVMINGANACNVFWQVGSSATLDTTTTFQGNILALTSITLNTGASVYGRVLAQNGAVTMDSNTMPASCAVAPPAATATNTPVGAATNTPVGANTNTPVGANTNTPVGANTNTPVGANTNTPVGANTNTPVGANTNTPTATSTLLATVPGTLTPVATAEAPTLTPTGTGAPTSLDPTGEPVVLQAVTLYLPLVGR